MFSNRNRRNEKSIFWATALTLIITALAAAPLLAAEQIERTLKPTIELNGQQLAWVTDNPTITVAALADWPPFEFREKGRYKGLHVDILKLAAHKAGLQIKPVYDKWSVLDNKLQKGELDLCPGLNATDARKKYLVFTEPVSETSQAVITKATAAVDAIADLKGRTVAIEKGFSNEAFLRTHHPEVTLLPVENTIQALKAVITNKADAYIGTQAVSLYLIKKHRFKGFKTAAFFEEAKPSRYRIGVIKSKPLLRDILQKGLDAISDEEMAKVELKWFGMRQSQSEAALTNEEKAWVEAHPKVRVHNEMAWAPFNYYEHGIPKGFSIEYMNLLATKVGLEIKYVTGPEWNEFLELIRDKNLDVMLNIVKTKSRMEYINYTRPYAKNPSVIVSPAAAPLRSIEELSGKTVAVVAGFYQEEILESSVPQAKRLRLNNMEACLKAVAFGNAEATLGELAVVKHLMAANMLTGLQVTGELAVGNPDIENLRIGVRKDWSILVGILEKAMAAVTPGERAALEANWLTKESDRFRLTVAEERWLKAHPELRLGIDPGWPPFEYFNEKGEHAGISADYVRLLENRLGISIVPQKGLKTWAQVMDSTRAGKIDILSSVGKIDAREKYLEFTPPYLENPLVIVTRKDAPPVLDIKALKGKSVAVQRDTFQWQKVSEALPGQELVAVENLAEALQAVSEGRADATVDNITAINYMERKLGFDNIKVASVTSWKIAISFAVRKDMQVLAGILNRALASIHPQEKALIQEKWVNVQVQSRTDWGYVWKVALSVGGFLLIILIFILRSNQKLAREASKRKIQEKRFRALIEGAPDAMVIVDENGLIQRINNQAEKVFGYNRSELVGRAIETLAPEEIRERHPQLRQGYLQNPTAWEANKTFSLRAQAKDGHIFPVDVNLSPLETEEGTRVVASVRDVTERKKAESRLRLTQYAMDKAVHAILWMSPDDGHFLYANDAAIEQLGYAREELLKMRAPDVDITLTPASWGEFVEHLSEKDFLTLESRQHRKDGAIRDVTVTNYLSEYEDSAIIVAFVEDITDHKLAEKARMESERRFRSYFESSQIGMAVTSPEKGWLEANEPLKKMLGYSFEELQQTLWTQLTHPEDLQADLDQFERMLAGDIDQYALDKRFIRKNGSVLSANLTVACVRDANGAVQNVLASYLDITERKQAEEQLRFTQHCVDSAADTVMWIDPETGRFTYVNHAACHQLGYNLEELLEMSVPEVDMNFPADKLADLRAYLKENHSKTFESRHRAKDGSLFDVELSIYLAQLGQKQLLVANAKDITERKQAEKALQESEERSRMLLDSAGEGIFGVDIKGRVTFMNPAAAQMLNYTEKELLGKSAHKHIHHSHPDGTGYLVETCPMYHACTDGTNQTISDEMLWCKDGTGIPVEYTATPIFQGDQITGAVITFRDITERKEAEATLIETKEMAEAAREEAEAKHQELLLLVESLPIPTALFDPEGDVTVLNQAFISLFGYTIEDIPSVEAHWAPFYPDPVYREQVREDWTGRVQRSSETGAPIEPMDLVITAKTGKVLNLQAHTIQVGPIAATMWVDFTEHKRMEKNLDEERERLQSILDTSPVGVAFSTKGVIHFTNPRFQEMFAAKVGEPSPNLYVHPEERDQLVQMLSDKGRVKNFELQMYGHDKKIRDMLVNYMPITYQGEEGILGWLLDISDRKKAELEIKKKFDELTRFRRLAVGREKKMIELKKEINDLLKERGESEKYKIH